VRQHLATCTFVCLIEAAMFTSLESGKDESELQNGGLSLKRNPLVVSIIDGCETLKSLISKSKITPDLIAAAKGLILMRTDKVCSSWLRTHMAGFPSCALC